MMSAVKGHYTASIMIRRYLRRVSLLLMATVLLALWGCSGQKDSGPAAREGVIDLSLNAGPWAQSTLNLNGEWALHWQQLLTPADFQKPAPPAPSAFIHLPGAWNDTRIGGEKIGSAGVATLRLHVFLDESSGELALKLGTIESAYRLWVNSELL